MTKLEGLLVVLDTNILVSSLLSVGPPALIVDRIAERNIRPCFDDRILSEYCDVLSRPKFGFSPLQIDRLIHDVMSAGFAVETSASGEVLMPDESDRKFYEVAKTAGAILITGNIKHYPDEEFIVTPAVFVQKYYAKEPLPKLG
jgi:putative PIN family toxin of toxin-antitoxin system